MQKSPSTNTSHPLRDAWRASRGGLIAILAFGAFINVLKFAMPLYTLQILDRVPASRSVETLIMLTVIALPTVIAGVALYAVRRRMLTQLGAWIERRFGPRLLRSDLPTQSSAPSGTSTPALDDVSALRSFVSRAAADWLDIMWAPVFVVAVYLVHPALGWLVMATAAVLLALGILRERATRETRRASSAASGDAGTLIQSMARNSETVQAFGMETALAERWGQSAATRLDERDRTEARMAVFAALEQGLYRCLYVGGLALGMWLVIQGTLTLGGVIAGNIMIRFTFRLVARPACKWRALVNARRAYSRLAGALESERTAQASVREADLKDALRFENVTHRYAAQSDPVFRRIELTASPGEILCVIGPSAAGKTTLSRLLTGILAPRAGRVRLGDIDISRLPSDMRAQIVGYLPQDIRLFRGSVRDNIARMAVGSFEDVVAAAKLANIHDAVVNLPQGYDTEIDEEASVLSGGERKRIALARAYFGNPQILVLDEPEANLDRHSRKAVIRALRHFKALGTIIVVTSQTSRLGRIADKVLILGGNRAEVLSGGDIELPPKGRSGDAIGPVRKVEQVASEDRK